MLLGTSTSKNLCRMESPSDHLIDLFVPWDDEESDAYYYYASWCLQGCCNHRSARHRQPSSALPSRPRVSCCRRGHATRRQRAAATCPSSGGGRSVCDRIGRSANLSLIFCSGLASDRRQILYSTTFLLPLASDRRI